MHKVIFTDPSSDTRLRSNDLNCLKRPMKSCPNLKNMSWLRAKVTSTSTSMSKAWDSFFNSPTTRCQFTWSESRHLCLAENYYFTSSDLLVHETRELLLIEINFDLQNLHSSSV